MDGWAMDIDIDKQTKRPGKINARLKC